MRVAKGGSIFAVSLSTAQKKHRSGDEHLLTLSDLTGPGIESQTSRTDSDVLNNRAKRAKHM